MLEMLDIQVFSTGVDIKVLLMLLEFCVQGLYIQFSSYVRPIISC